MIDRVPESATFSEWMAWAGIGFVDESTYYRTIGENIRRLRKARGWSQQRLAIELGIDYSAGVSYWEAGEKRSSAWMIDRIEQVFGEKVRP